MANKPKTKGKTTMTDTTTAAVATKQSLEERLANAEKLVEKYKAQINAEKQINNVQVDDEGVTFKFGRAEKARELSGKIVAVADTDNGKVVSILCGEGVDIEIKKVRAADIISNPSADARNGEAAEGGDAADADPLAAE